MDNVDTYREQIRSNVADTVIPLWTKERDYSDGGHKRMMWALERTIRFLRKVKPTPPDDE